jgi:serine/threonine protein kinase/tetratricopeptide (TPR) repeat protein
MKQPFRDSMSSPSLEFSSAAVDIAAKDDAHIVAAAEMATALREAWSRGQTALAEDFLEHRPELWQQPAAAMEVIYEEVLLREEKGERAPWEDLLRRFPQWRDQLHALKECHQVLDISWAPTFPAVGETVGEYRLLAELGRGALGRVFLASQPALANRAVVLKVTPRSGREHWLLAQLQHTHIVPLFAARDDRGRRLRFLCMPYFGGATLSDILRELADIPANERTGKLLIDAVDRLQAARPVCVSPANGPRNMLARMTYPQAISWIAACCADALYYAHERGILHLDLKPSNILIAADGQPMLLDFHLAHEPIATGHPLPDQLGGTPAFMAPEQRAAAEAVDTDHPIHEPVDGRADIYGLGALVYETLGGRAPYRPGMSLPLNRINAEVSPGLSDIVGRSLAWRPAERYRDAAALAADLRNHITNRPLGGVRNRSLVERWAKWRKRQPGALRFVAMIALVLCATGALALGAWLRVSERIDEARSALAEGERQRQEQHYADAEATLRHGLALVEAIPGCRDLKQELGGMLDQVSTQHIDAVSNQLCAGLHEQAEQMRVLFGMEVPPSSCLTTLLERCRDVWSRRFSIRHLVGEDKAQQVGTDLLELAVLWTDLRARSASDSDVQAALREALQVLSEAKEFFGNSPLIAYQELLYRKRLSLPAPADRIEISPATAPWEHEALGRYYFRAGGLQRAAEEFKEALAQEPHNCWSNYYFGLCAYRLKQFADAATAFSVCIGAAPRLAGLYYNRALAFAALGRNELALLDYGRALELDSTLASAELNRAMLYFQEKRYAEAEQGLRHALELGAGAAAVHYNFALVELAQNHRDRAQANVRRALNYAPADPQIRQMLKSLESPKAR